MSNAGDVWGIYDEEGRECRRCWQYLPYSEFHKHSGCPHGHNTICKQCRKRDSTRQWATKSPEYRLWHGAKSRAKKRGLPFTITLDDIVIPEVCPVLGTPMDTPSIDQHCPAMGYTPDNIVIMSNRANVLKNNGTLDEFRLLVKYLEER